MLVYSNSDQHSFSPGFLKLVEFDEAVSHPKSHGRWTVWVGSQSFLIESQSTSVVLLVEGNTSLTKQGGDVVWGLVERKQAGVHKVKMSLYPSMSMSNLTQPE